MKKLGMILLAFGLCMIAFRLFSPSTSVPQVNTIQMQHNVTRPASASLKVSDAYHIAYLLAHDAEFEDEIERPENLFKGLEKHRVSVVHTWSELLALYKRQPFNALVLHTSAVPMVDFQWTAHAYWRGLTISTLGIYPAMIGHLYDHACLPLGYGMPFYGEGTYYTVSTSTLLSLQDRDQIARWHRRDWRRNCTYPRPAEVREPYGWMIYYTSGPLVTGTQDVYQEMLLGHIQEADSMREEFEKEHQRTSGVR